MHLMYSILNVEANTDTFVHMNFLIVKGIEYLPMCVRVQSNYSKRLCSYHVRVYIERFNLFFAIILWNSYLSI